MSTKSNTKIFQAYYSSLNFNEKKILRKELSKACGVDVQTVWTWARGTRFPKLSTQKIIAEVVGIPHNKLFCAPIPV